MIRRHLRPKWWLVKVYLLSIFDRVNVNTKKLHRVFNVVVSYKVSLKMGLRFQTLSFPQSEVLILVIVSSFLSDALF